MAEVVNNSTNIPFEEHKNFEEGQVDAGTDELNKLEPEEIAEILRKQNLPKETPSEKVKEEEKKKEEDEKVEEDEFADKMVNALEDEDESDTETDDNESDEEDEFALPDKLKGKTKEEIAEMYINAEKLGSKHTAELGELRKKKTEFDTAKEIAKKYENEMSANKVTPQPEKWTKEEVALFIQKLGEDPQAAFSSLINPYIKPLATSAAQTRNERQEEKLIADNKDKLIPYDRAEVNSILKANPNLWKQHGTKAIKIAFDMYKESAFDKAMETKEAEFDEKLKEKQQNKDKEQATHTLGVGPAGKKGTGGNMRKAIDKISKMDPDKALKILSKVLDYSK